MRGKLIRKSIFTICTGLLLTLGMGDSAQAATGNKLSYYYSTTSEAYAIKGYTPSANEDDYTDKLVVPNIFSDEINGVTYTGPVVQVNASVFTNHKFQYIYFKNEYTMNIQEKAFQNVEVKRPLLSLDSDDGSIIFKGDISTIGVYAFNNIKLDGYLEFQGKVDTIEDYALSHMQIKGIKGDYIRVIGKGALSNNELTTWKSKGTEIIGDNAFEYCTQLAEMDIPDTVTSIGTKCFKGCTSLKKITLPANKELVIGEAAFPNQSGLVVVIPAEITNISDYHFESLSNVVFQIEENCSSTVIQYLEDHEIQYKKGENGEVLKGGENTTENTENGNHESDVNKDEENTSESTESVTTENGDKKEEGTTSESTESGTTESDGKKEEGTTSESTESGTTESDGKKEEGTTSESTESGTTDSNGNKDGGTVSGGNTTSASTENGGNTSGSTTSGNTGSYNTEKNNSVSTGDTSASIQTSEKKSKKRPKKGKTYVCDNLYYKVTGSSTVTFMKPKKNVTKIIIPSTVTISGWKFKVTKVNKKACYKNKKITSVTVGDNVTHIGDMAFAYCSKLQRVTMGIHLTHIGKMAMYQDKKIKCVYMKKSLKIKKIEPNAFLGIKKDKNTKIIVPTQKYSKYTKMIKKSDKK